jgi:glutathione S-transferase
MAKPLLIIGNKNYSSWSMRPWLALEIAGIAFDEKMIRFGEPRFGKQIKKISKAMQVPVLLHRGLMIWDTLAIIEYAAETWPKNPVWPKKPAARAMARSACAEMHAGFRNLRNACPMNLRRKHRPLRAGTPEAVLKDVARLEQILLEARATFAGKKPFMFGELSAADAYFAPICSRLETYKLPVKKQTRAYMEAVFSTAAFQYWKREGLKESWIVPEDEAD